jgi:uncharacterized membrane protein YeaQ/YmgE (transglycosylase-associated protein family)
MDTYLQTGLSIIVSVGLFLIGYRQTIGAKKERIKTANEKLIEIILRRLVLEKYKPQKNDLKKIIEGKSRDFRVKSSDLLTERQVLTTVYTRVFESDLITHEQREEILERLLNLFEEEKQGSKQEVESSLLKDKRKTKFYSYIIILGLVSSIIGVFLSSFDKIVNLDTDYPKLDNILIISLIGSIVTIAIIYLFIKVKDSSESSEDTTINPNIKDYVEFEKEVLKAFTKLKIEYSIPEKKDIGFDCKLPLFRTIQK